MDVNLSKIHVKRLTDNVFRLLEDDWMLLTAGSPAKYNAMTASWGTFGILWNKPVVIGFIRPQRYTLELVNESNIFTLSFFTEKYRKVLEYCGNHSGRDVNKIKETQLTPIFTEHGGIIFSESRLVVECKKMYADVIRPDKFIMPELIQNIYPKGDYHHFFIGEIISCMTSDPIILRNLESNDVSEDADL